MDKVRYALLLLAEACALVGPAVTRAQEAAASGAGEATPAAAPKPATDAPDPNHNVTNPNPDPTPKPVPDKPNPGPGVSEPVVDKPLPVAPPIAVSSGAAPSPSRTP